MGDNPIAVNFYLDHFQNRTEQTLVEDLTIESIKMYGVDMLYMPREIIERDEIYGEDIITKFDSNYMLEMYVETVDGFEGGQDVLAKFGLQIVDQATFILAKRRFEETVPDQKRPMEGDLIYFPLSNSIFEINHVEHENPFYQLGKLHTYKLTVELFTYSHEQFETGYDDIDRVSLDRTPEAEVERADNVAIQVEANESLDKSEKSHYPSSADNHRFNPDDPFGGF